MVTVSPLGAALNATHAAVKVVAGTKSPLMSCHQIAAHAPTKGLDRRLGGAPHVKAADPFAAVAEMLYDKQQDLRRLHPSTRGGGRRGCTA